MASNSSIENNDNGSSSYELVNPGGLIKDLSFGHFPSDSVIKMIAYMMAFPEKKLNRSTMEHYYEFVVTNEQYEHIFAIYQLITKYRYLVIDNPENPDCLCGQPEGLLKVPHCHICQGSTGMIHRDALSNKSDMFYIIQIPSKAFEGQWVSIPMLFCHSCGSKTADVVVRDGTPHPTIPETFIPHKCRLLPVSFKIAAILVLFNYGESMFQAKIDQCLPDFVWKPTPEEEAAEDAVFAQSKALEA